MIQSLRLLAMVSIMGMVSVQSRAQGVASSSDEKFARVMSEMQQLHGNRRYAEAMAKLDEAEALKPGSPIVVNARGSVYTGMRDFPKAREWFKKSEAASPRALGPKFNLAELDFVQADYATAAASFGKLLADFPRMPPSIRQVAQFKLFVCHLKLGRTAEAETMLKNFAFKEGSAPHTFSQAATAFQKGDKAGAAVWIDKAALNAATAENTVFLDTLMEARWIPSENVPAEQGK